ncbi:MAG: Tetratricopeptide 2 repeat protein, partial [Verrucomicrobiales bacterium]|nr:Tetratricopeptide 2 repeat protein [Verrucomicrobiales bacterium]
GSAQGPLSQFLSWQPGKLPPSDANADAWKLEKGSDLVLQVHMQPTGKPERIQPSVAFYFSDQPSSNIFFKMGFDSFTIDIPAGETNYVVKDSYRLPVDLEVIGVLPHAHYLGKRLQSFATLPNGTRKWLLSISDWNFNWQGDYRYAQPMFLPKGSTIQMEFSYDNSTNNLRNPHHPPERVQYGLQTTDEMANLAFIFRLSNQHDLEVLQQNYQYKGAQDIIHYNEYALRVNPNDAHAHAQLGKVLLALGRSAEAQTHLQESVRLNPHSDDSHYHLAIIFEDQGRIDESKAEYRAALKDNPENIPACNNLGLLCLKTGDLNGAEDYFNRALRLRPEDEIVRENLELLRKARLAPK